MIPYAHRVVRDGIEYAMCPVCGQRIELKERKDFESGTGNEYAKHYESEHASEGGK